MTETRVVNEKTGGEKGTKPEQYALLPWDALDEVARLYAKGAEKYARDNWRKGYDWHLSFDSLVRHAKAFWMGESVDEETECHHLSSVVFHALALMVFEREHPELDDRPNTAAGRGEVRIAIGADVLRAGREFARADAGDRVSTADVVCIQCNLEPDENCVGDGCPHRAWATSA